MAPYHRDSSLLHNYYLTGYTVLHMPTHTFSIREALNVGWAKTKEHFWYLLSVFAICVLIIGAAHRTLLHPIAGFLLGISIITVSLAIVHNKIPTYYDLIKSFRTYVIPWKSFLSSLLYCLIVLLGLIAFILPGIYLAIRLQFYKYIAVEHQHLKVTDILRESMRITQGHFWKLFAFLIVIILINIVGALPFGILLVITIPITLLAYAHVYKKLSNGSSLDNTN